MLTSCIHYTLLLVFIKWCSSSDVNAAHNSLSWESFESDIFRQPRTAVDSCNPPCQNGGECWSYRNACKCPPGFTGATCSETCPAGKYGSKCLMSCSCQNGALCNAVTGECTCRIGYQGKSCVNKCDSGFHGMNCVEKCDQICFDKEDIDVDSQICEPETGDCSCLPGKYGPRCSERCESKSDDPKCEQNPCTCENGGNCTEYKSCNCAPGFQGKYCSHECPEGKYGLNCARYCPFCEHGNCDKRTGSCICVAGFEGHSCNEVCSAGTFGLGCKQKCDCPFNLGCDPVTGVCMCKGNTKNPKNCSIIYEDCERGLFGPYCDHTCPASCETRYCDRLTGNCLSCDEGGKECKPFTQMESSSSSAFLVVLVALIIITALVVVITLFMIIKRCRNQGLKVKYDDSKHGARLMLTPSEVTFVRDPATGNVQAHCNMGAVLRKEEEEAIVATLRKQHSMGNGHGMGNGVIAQPSYNMYQQQHYNPNNLGYSSLQKTQTVDLSKPVPLKYFGEKSLLPQATQSVENPYVAEGNGDVHSQYTPSGSFQNFSFPPVFSPPTRTPNNQMHSNYPRDGNRDSGLYETIPEDDYEPVNYEYCDPLDEQTVDTPEVDNTTPDNNEFDTYGHNNEHNQNMHPPSSSSNRGDTSTLNPFYGVNSSSPCNRGDTLTLNTSYGQADDYN